MEERSGSFDALTPNDVAVLLQTEETHILRVIHAGILPATPVDDTYRITFQDFREFSEQRKQATQDVESIRRRANAVPALQDKEMEDLRNL